MPSVIVSGVSEFKAATIGLEARFNEAARTVVVKGGALVAKAAQREFTSLAMTRSGEVRVIPSGGGKRSGERLGTKYRGGHVAGDRPHIRTGNLARSIATRDVQMVSPGRWMSTTGPTMAYGRRVELGFTGSDSRGRHYNQKAYPYMSPGFDKAKPEIIALYEHEFKQALNG
jgi:hypothetical protein